MLKQYKNLGWQTIPIPKRSKAPTIEDWQTPRDYPDKDYENIGVLLGSVSHDLVDVDLDHENALRYAKYFLPSTAIFGRPSKPQSHYIYYSKGLKTKKFTNDKIMIVELRSDNHQTVFPPSTHPSGEIISWYKDETNIITIDEKDLTKAVALLACASLVHDYWSEGVRQELSLYLSGVLIQEFELTESISKHFIWCLATENNDPQINDRIRTVESTYDKITIGDKIGSWGKLEAIIGKLSTDTLKKWLSVIKTKSNKIKRDNSFTSLVNILENDENIFSKLSYNKFTQKREYEKKAIEDFHVHKIRLYLNKSYGIEFSRIVVDEALLYICEQNSYDPLSDYVNSLEWDGIDRFPELYTILNLTVKEKIERTFIKKFLLGAISRALEPGCKFDTMLVLVGKQGYYKSTFLRKICPYEDWFSDQIQGIEKPDDLSLLLGKWIIEFGELYAISKSKKEMIKRYLSRQEDEFRRPYAHNTKVCPRRCVFIGTTNTFEFLDDETGDRRTWVVEIKKPILIDRLMTIREQLWAQLLHIYKHNLNYYANDESKRKGYDFVLSQEEEESREKLNRKYTIYDDIEETLLDLVKNRIGFSYSWLTNNLGLSSDIKTYHRIGKILVANNYRLQPRKGLIGKRWYPTNLKLMKKMDPNCDNLIRMDEVSVYNDEDDQLTKIIDETVTYKEDDDF